MIRVALETSTRTPSVAVARGDVCLEEVLAGERPHASDLLPALDRLIARVGGTPAEISAVVVGTGPGSYTGLRVGVATALGLARGTGARLRGLPSGEALAWKELKPGERAVLLMDARQGELYFARYERTEHEVRMLVEPRVVRPAELALPPEDAIFGDAGIEHAAQLDEPAVRRCRTVLPSAAAALALGSLRLEREGAHAPSEIEPLYLRAFAARPRRR